MTDGNWKKLTPEDVAEIRVRAEAGTRKNVLAREYNVAATTVRYHTLHGKAGVTPFARFLERAAECRRVGDMLNAAHHLRKAADALLESATPETIQR